MFQVGQARRQAVLAKQDKTLKQLQVGSYHCYFVILYMRMFNFVKPIELPVSFQIDLFIFQVFQRCMVFLILIQLLIVVLLVLL